MATTNNNEISSSNTTEGCYGIVTRVDWDHCYVWASRLGTAELKYARSADTSMQFKPGEVATFVQSLSVNSVQLAANLFKCDEQKQASLIRMVESSPNSGLPFAFKVETLLSFAPDGSAFFNGIREKDDEDRVQAVAWSDDFKLVVSYVENIKYDVGAVYKAWVARIPTEQTGFGVKIGTLFMVVDTDMTEFEVRDKQIVEHMVVDTDMTEFVVTDKQTVEQFFKKCPWIQQQSVNAKCLEDSTTAAEIEQLQEETSQQQDLSRNDPESAFFEEEPLADTYIEAAHHNEAEQHTGIIVRCEPDFSVIWSATQEVVCIPAGNGYDSSLAAWVHFRCIPEQSHRLRCGLLCQHTAYDIQKAVASRKTIVIKNGESQQQQTVAVQMAIRNAREHSTQFLLADTVDFCGGKTTPVLCSCKDGRLRERMCVDKRGVEVYAMYTPYYKYSKWVVVAVWDEAVKAFIGVQGLPASIENKVGNFFQKPSAATQPKKKQISAATAHAMDGTTVQHNDVNSTGDLFAIVPKEEEQPKMNDHHLPEDDDHLANHQFGSFSRSTSSQSGMEEKWTAESMKKQVSRNVGWASRQTSSSFHSVHHDQQQLVPVLSSKVEMPQKRVEEPIVADLIDFGPEEQVRAPDEDMQQKLAEQMEEPILLANLIDFGSSEDLQQIQAAPNELVQKLAEKVDVNMNTGGPSSSAGENAKRQPTVGPKLFEMLSGEQSTSNGQTGGASNKVEAGKQLKHLLAEFWDDDGN